MADGWDVYVTGDESAQRKLAQLELHLTDLRGYWPLLVPRFISWMGDLFRTQGASALGQEWSPLSPSYAAEKARTHPGRSILIRDGGLRQAASRPHREATARTLTLTIESDVAAFHQDGTRDMPARPLIPSRIPESWRRDIDDAAREYVSVLIRQIGF